MVRLSLSPTHDMTIEELRIAILSYILAKHNDTHFIVRIDDSNKEQNIEGKDSEFMQILEKFALPHDKVFHQSENLHIHQTLAIKLLQEKKASLVIDGEDCSSMTNEEFQKIKTNKVPFEVQLNNTKNKASIKDQNPIILHKDGTPSTAFALVCDDMLNDIDMIISSDSLDSIEFATSIKKQLGFNKETHFILVSPVIYNTNQEHHVVKWLLSEGYIPDAIINYLLTLSNNTPEEFFTLPEAIAWYDFEMTTTNRQHFDLEKLKRINQKHILAMNSKELSRLFGFADSSIGELAKVYLQQCYTTKELEVKIKTIFAPKDFTRDAGKIMRLLERAIMDAPPFEDYDTFEADLIQRTNLSKNQIEKPLRILLTGEDKGIKLSDIYPYIKSYILEIAS